MSLVSKKGLEFIINQVGKAKYAYKDLVGDLSTKHGYFLDYERIAVKLRGSTIFHDYDLSGKTPQGLLTKPYQTFDTDEDIFFKRNAITMKNAEFCPAVHDVIIGLLAKG